MEFKTSKQNLMRKPSMEQNLLSESWLVVPFDSGLFVLFKFMNVYTLNKKIIINKSLIISKLLLCIQI